MELFGKLPKELGEPWWQQDGVAAQDQVGVLVTELEVFRRQVAKTFGGQAEQQGDRAAGPDVRRQGIAGQAALVEPPAIVVLEQVLGILARAGGDGQFAGEPARLTLIQGAQSESLTTGASAEADALLWPDLALADQLHECRTL
ncbi:hypothetical protein SNA_14015 [Streptomyces natalensis ATCC 27448]|uniref:Uncharacterized protein n=1 Tax=Streptomyces natalensis ATCC 27448 TaxID=1240678 RepID=A0A0D7CQ96_9ACTN|nr:hypothetical protein SNA_14015 [Streptomyces natalensis ATCC 27448]